MNVYKSCPSCGAVLKIDSAANGALMCPKCKNKCHTRELKDVPSVMLVCPECKTGLKSYVSDNRTPICCRKCGYQGLISTYGRYNAQSLVGEQPVRSSRDGHTQINTPTPQPHRIIQSGVRADATQTVIRSGGSVRRIPVYARPLSLRLYSERDGAMWYGDKELPRLRQGRQVIGRIGKSADIECPTRDLYFSRTHFAIEVEYNSRIGSFRHYLCHNGHDNAIQLKQQGGAWIEVRANDMPIINAGDLIRVGHTELEVYYEVAHK